MPAKQYFTISLLLFFAFTISAFGQKLDVKIVERFTSETGYSNYAPGYSYVGANNASVHATYLPARTISYSVTGATFALLLPDGRVTIVNCVSKYKLKADYVNKRSCRTPVVTNIKAEFKKDNAKLKWSVSLDGKKTQSETYKILGVFEKNEWGALTGN